MTAFDHHAALTGCARRETAALRSIYEHDGALLLAVALRIVRRPDVARDVLHDAFLDIWEKASSFDPARGSGLAWIVSITRYRALKAVRRDGRETALDGSAHARVADEGPDPFGALSSVQETERLRICLDALPEERRAVILLAYVDGLSQSEIARRLATPLGTVKAWVRRSLLSLRECLR